MSLTLGLISSYGFVLIGLLVPIHAVIGYWTYRVLFRGRRFCCNCRFPMTKLDHGKSNDELLHAERVEQKVRSADYDVWACQSCGTVAKVRFGRFFTAYSRCPKCQVKTKSSTTETLEHATEYSHGVVLVTERCESCHYASSEERVTPMLDDASFHDASSR